MENKKQTGKYSVLSLVIAVVMLAATGCTGDALPGSAGEDYAIEKIDAENKFRFLSAEWGASWEDIQEDTGLSGEVQETDNRQIAKVKDVEYLGVKGTAFFQFDKQFENTYYGLYDVVFVYEDVDKEKIMVEMQKVYGERKKSYLDKNGFENPIGFSGGWVSEETMEDSMTEPEKYIERMGNIEQSRKEAILRSPLVSIIVDEEENSIEFKGSAAATVKYMEENN